MLQNSTLDLILHILILFSFAFISYFLTTRFRRIVIERNIYDEPNERSSHSHRTPLGGGLAIGIITIAVLISLAIWHRGVVIWNHYIILGALVVLIVSFIDDIKRINPILRLSAHFVAASIIVYAMGSNPELSFLPILILKGVPAQVFTIFYVVWMINLFNFMDGIDGLAGIQAVSVTLIAGAISWFYNFETLCIVFIVISGTSLGFLKMNWMPARIFMGDAGSCTIGYFIAALSLWGELKNGVPLVTIMILMGVFIVDATYTLLVRLVRGDKIYQAHHDHTFQHIIQKGLSHSKVSASVGLINLFWLAPLAFLSMYDQSNLFFYLIAAFIPLLIIAIYFKAGIKISKKV
ncbi:MAG: glycosyltransferase family 4 protein [Calditrichaeota bacterium]|nr:glycosyltransferase family 4 protein [Calditrichota bacterium]